MFRKFFLPLISSVLITSFVPAQNAPLPTSAEDRLNGYQKRLDTGKHILQNLKFSSIGPTIMGGRVTDVAVSPHDPNTFYIAYASGGLFLTKNNGQSYSPVFDNEMVISIGDIAVDWKNDVIWIGTGENNSSRSSYSGTGIYKSTDQGKSWLHSGLEDSHHIGRIVLDPENPDIIFVAVLGHLYSPNEERGIYKSSDGGKTWNKVLYVDENTGAIDLVINPKNKDVLYAAMWHRQRRAWNFVESGEKSGIYRSDDSGDSWKIFSGESSGFPAGEGMGRIGLAITADGSRLYALLDNQNRREKKDEEEEGLSKEMLREMSKEDFLKLEKEDLQEYLKKNNFPKKLDVDTLKAMVRNDQIKAFHLVDYVEDANQKLFDTKVVGAEVYSANEGISSWNRTHEGFLDDVVFSYGYYFGQIRVSPSDNDKIYIVGVPILKSEDGGKTFKSINGDNQHVDHHALWVSPDHDGHLINGNDGGLNLSYDDGENWLKLKSPPVGQFYTVNTDNAKPYNVYGGLQDNGVWMGPSTYKEGNRWQHIGRYPYKHIMGGDGFKVEIDNRDNKTVYTGYQFGHYFRFNREGGKKTKITPKHILGERPLRFNWQTPIYLSRHNQDILYFGSNKFHRSLDQGNTYDLVSKDLTKGGKEGDVAFGTITCIHESPLRFGLIYLGTDDGLVYRSDDVGYNWTNISSGLPENMWITGVQASNHDSSRIYVTLNGYRWDHFEAYIFVSDDYGDSWKRLGNNMPLEPVNVVKEDPNNQNIIYVGTDHGLYISLDRGVNFYFMNNGIPAVPVHDLVVQEREKDLIVATHGRSLYKVDLSEIQLLSETLMDKGIHLFKLSSVKYSDHWGKQYSNWKEARSPKLHMALFVKDAGIYEMQVQYESDYVVYSASDTLESGLNYYEYDLSFNESVIKKYKSLLDEKDRELKKADSGKYYLKPGKYKIVWISERGKDKAVGEFNIERNDKK